MSEASFVFNFNLADVLAASQDFPKSNIVDLGGSTWYLGVEMLQSANRDYSKMLNIFLTCERGTCNGNYTATLALMLRGSIVELLFTRTYYFEPLDLEMPCFQIDLKCISDVDNGFINENGLCDIVAEISIRPEEEIDDMDEDFSFLNSYRSYNSSSLKELNGIVNLQGGHCVRVCKELFSWHSEYFKNIFNNDHFEESSQEAIDLTDFTYKQFRLLYKHIYVESVHLASRYLCTDGAIGFRLMSEDGGKQYHKLSNLTEIQKYCQLHPELLEQTNDASSKELLKANSCMVDDVRQLKAVLGIIRCISTEYVWKDQTVSAENVDDLLFVGSYFQIHKIMDSCIEFLSRNCDYPDFSSQDRMNLVHKYNLASVKVPSFDNDTPIIPRDGIFTEVLVNVNFLDTGREEMCSVNYENLMKIRTLLSDALALLYSTGVCDNPSKYELERVRISDPDTPFASDCQCVDVKDNVIFTLGCVYSSRIYSFEVRQKPGFDSKDWGKPYIYLGSEQSTSKVPSMQRTTSSTFNRMRTEDVAQKPDLYNGSEQSTSNVPSTQNNGYPTVNRKRTEIVAQKPDLNNGSEQSTSKRFIRFDPTGNRIRTKNLAQKPDFHIDSEQFTSKVPSTQSNACPTVNKNRVKILAHLTFLDSGEEKTCIVPCNAGMTIQDLFFRACRLADNVFPSLYEIVAVNARYADSISDGEFDRFDIPTPVRSIVHSAYAYSFQVRLSTDTPSTSKDCSQRPWKLIKLDDV
ncbi:BTB/POZ domain-containing protein [Ditylenchus destructor]|nr:BTB/POZ domain-containing protein [Ditylenchus destructor]